MKRTPALSPEAATSAGSMDMVVAGTICLTASLYLIMSFIIYKSESRLDCLFLRIGVPCLNVAEHNCEPKPFVWTADPDAMVEKVRQGYHALASIGRQAG